MIPERTLEFQQIIPISAITGEGIDELKNCIRKSLDEHANQENDAYHKKQLLNHTLTKFVLNLYSVLETITGTRDTVVNKTELPAFLKLTFYFEKRDNKQTNKNKLYSMSAGHRVIEAK